jgi:hypothetical protein
MSLLQKGGNLAQDKGGLPITLNKGVCHTVALPFTLKKKYLKAKEEEL